jgi:hypothetical protein
VGLGTCGPTRHRHLLFPRQRERESAGKDDRSPPAPAPHLFRFALLPEMPSLLTLSCLYKVEEGAALPTTTSSTAPRVASLRPPPPSQAHQSPWVPSRPFAHRPPLLLRLWIRSNADCFLFVFFFSLARFPRAGKIKIGINGEPPLPHLFASRRVVGFRIARSSDFGALRARGAPLAQVSEGSAGSSPGSPSSAPTSTSSPSTTPSSPPTTWRVPPASV